MGLINLILIVIGLVIVYYLYKVAAYVNRKQEVKAAIAALPDFTCTYSHVGDGGYDGIAIDESNASICFLTRSRRGLASYRATASDIVSSEIFENSLTRTSQSGGGLLLIVGRIGVPVAQPRVTTRYNVARIELRTVVNDPAVPVHTVTFIGSECKRGGIAHTFNSEQAKQWQARIHVLATRAQCVPTEAQQQLTSVADELRKLAALTADGLLSEDEFNTQRAKLLL